MLLYTRVERDLLNFGRGYEQLAKRIILWIFLDFFVSLQLLHVL